MKNIFKILLFASLASTNVSAQFNKYKSRSKFTAKKSGESKTRNKEEDAFGRGSGINSFTAPPKSDSPYVNLNPETAFGPEVIESFDFPNADILEITKHMQKLTGINLILDKDVKGKISILAPTPITVGDAWKAYLTALNLNGLTLVKSGAFYKIIQARDVRYTPAKIYTGKFTPDTDNYVMKIIPLKNIDVSEVQTTFRPLISRYGRLMAIKQTNTLIVHDTGAQINRIQQLLKFLDVPGHEMGLQIIKVHHSSAQEIAKLLDQILQSGTSSRFRSSAKSSSNKKQNIGKIIAEPRTNSIIAMANSDGEKELRTLIGKLDVETPSEGSDRVHVYYLNYGDAESLAKTLGTLTTGSKQSTKSTRSSSSKLASRFSSSSTSTGLFSADVKVTADKDNNALVVTASPTDYLTIKNVIAKLDIPKNQVYVEGLIMETLIQKNRALGISIFGAYGSGATERAGFQPTGLMDLITNNMTNLSGLFVGAGAGSKVNVDLPNGSTVKIRSVNALIKAVAANNNTDILATPQILAQDNVEAIFEVGEKIPVEEKTIANGQTSISTGTQEVKLALKITPQINKVTRFVKLKIDQKVEDFSDRINSTGSGAATTFRTTVTTVVVRDRDTIAMGGLMRDKESVTESKVPLLGDIPILGWLFKQKEKSVFKTNLIFFLTPKILTPYEKTAASTMKDILNRRAAHLKDVYGEDDPFNATSKGLYKKAKKQAQGPLYNPDDSLQYQQSNDSNDGIRQGNYNPNIPNYQEIVRESNRAKKLTEDQKEEYMKNQNKKDQKALAKDENQHVPLIETVEGIDPTTEGTQNAANNVSPELITEEQMGGDVPPAQDD